MAHKRAEAFAMQSGGPSVQCVSVRPRITHHAKPGHCSPPADREAQQLSAANKISGGTEWHERTGRASLCNEGVV